jgi:hypothetical protein
MTRYLPILCLLAGCYSVHAAPEPPPCLEGGETADDAVELGEGAVEALGGTWFAVSVASGQEVFLPTYSAIGAECEGGSFATLGGTPAGGTRVTCEDSAEARVFFRLAGSECQEIEIGF